ncbi:MAG: hypothetical protein JWP52_2730 [Rhizobacter sp.]|nr:hypothetical protein [Rhizobacter sp.]
MTYLASPLDRIHPFYNPYSQPAPTRAGYDKSNDPAVQRSKQLLHAVDHRDDTLLRQALHGAPAHLLNQRHFSSLGHDRGNLLTIVADQRPSNNKEVMVALLVNAGSSVEARANQQTPLMQFARQGDTRSAQHLLKLGANERPLANLDSVNTRRGNRGAIHEAAANGDCTMVNMLITAGAKLNGLSLGGTPLFMANKRGHVQVADLLRRAGGESLAGPKYIPLSLPSRFAAVRHQVAPIASHQESQALLRQLQKGAFADVPVHSPHSGGSPEQLARQHRPAAR